MKKLKYGIGIWTVGFTADRFIPNGYRPAGSFVDQIKDISRIKGIEAVQIHFPDDFQGYTALEIKDIITSHGLVMKTVNMNLFGNPMFKFGSFTNADPKIRQAAIDSCMRGIETIRTMGISHLELWPGQDGFDYNFQSDYDHLWDGTVSALRDITASAKDIKFSYEYKLKEPRMYCLVSNAGRALALANEVGAENFGIALDYGHSLLSRENPAEALVFLNRAGKLFNVHFNDAYGEFDDDMISGTVSVWKTLEFIYHLKNSGYDGYVNLDMFPFREDQVEAAALAVRMSESFETLAETLDFAKIRQYQSENDLPAIFELLRKHVLAR